MCTGVGHYDDDDDEQPDDEQPDENGNFRSHCKMTLLCLLLFILESKVFYIQVRSF